MLKNGKALEELESDFPPAETQRHREDAEI